MTDAGATVTATVGDKAVYPGLVIGEDDRYDFAVVWICCSDDFQALSLAADGTYFSGDEIGAFGYPLGATVMQATWGNFDKVESQPDEKGWDMENRPLNLAGATRAVLLWTERTSHRHKCRGGHQPALCQRCLGAGHQGATADADRRPHPRQEKLAWHRLEGRRFGHPRRPVRTGRQRPSVII